jgi:guanine nucleotide-binding protein G(i) subunit alpha
MLCGGIAFSFLFIFFLFLFLSLFLLLPNKNTKTLCTGAKETQFSLDGYTFRIVDVGGQRSERRKWASCFEDVTAVVSKKYCQVHRTFIQHPLISFIQFNHSSSLYIYLDPSNIFCVSLSEYDMPLAEDPTQNRMHESLLLFKNTCNSNWFKDTPIIIFLNKRDIFQEKIRHVDLKVCFPEYDGKLRYKGLIVVGLK